MFFSVLLSFILGFVFKGTLVNFNNYSDKTLWVFVGLTLFMVIAIWAEIIGFIIHAAKNKSLDNRVGWSFLIYFFNFHNLIIIKFYTLHLTTNLFLLSLSQVINVNSIFPFVS